MIVTERIGECRDYYARWFGFEVVFEADWFVLLRSQGESAFALAFMRVEHPSSPRTGGVQRGPNQRFNIVVP